MNLTELILHVEALIFASEHPLKEEDIQVFLNNAFEFLEQKITIQEVQHTVQAIQEKYAQDFYPFEVLQLGGGWQFVTKAKFHSTIAVINKDKFLRRLSSAALETIAIIAYKQPISRAEIEHIRGVNCEYALQRLMEKELIVIIGRNNNLPGRPLLYGTSQHFMDYFGLNTPDDLPKINELIAQNVQSIGNLSETNIQKHSSASEAHQLLIDEEA